MTSCVLQPTIPSQLATPRDQRTADVLRRQVQERPHQPALISQVRSWTFAELNADINRLAQGLLSLGIGKGDRVACLTRHGAESALLLMAATRLGAVCAPLNWRLAGPEIEYVLANSEARLLLTDAEFLPALEGKTFPFLRATVLTFSAPTSALPALDHWLEQFPADDPQRDSQPHEAALQLYSSGTTGLPKGVVLSNHGLMVACWAYARVCKIDHQTRMLNSLPAFHIAGIENTLTTLVEGGTTLFHEAFDPAATLKAVHEEHVSHMFLVPTMMQMTAQHPSAAHTDFSRLRIVAYGGAPAAESLISLAQSTFGCGLLQVYGMTEACGPITWLLPEDHDPGGPRSSLIRSAGTPSPGVEVRIVEPGTDRDCGPAEVGEVWIRTLQNMLGYWRNDDATVAAFPEGRDRYGGWMRTGDAAFHQDGYVYIHDRIKDMIISGGENVYPAEIENVLAAHDAIAEAAVIGVPDDKWGEAVKACVVLKAGHPLKEGELISWLRERLAGYKCPKSVDFVASLPRNPTGKLLKRVLRQPYWEHHQRQVS
jgi:fatty-acyl-CoA synthase